MATWKSFIQLMRRHITKNSQLDNSLCIYNGHDNTGSYSSSKCSMCVEVQISSHSLEAGGDNCHELRETWSVPGLLLPAHSHHLISNSNMRNT